MDAALQEAIHWIVRAVEVTGIAVIVIGAGVSLAMFLRAAARGADKDAVGAFRSNLGRAILLGLEFLVAADIINTVAIDPTLESLAVLAGIIVVRTFLSFALEVEIEGRWPWRRGQRDST